MVENNESSNTSNYVPMSEIHTESDKDLSALDSKVLGLPYEYRPIRLGNDPVINKNYKDYSSSDNNTNVSSSKILTKEQ